jgi:Putative lumazine-binding
MTSQAESRPQFWTMSEDAGVRAAVLDYVEGWFEGNAERMERALHPGVVKRRRGLEGEDPDVMETLTARDMIDATAEGIGRREDAEDREIDVQITYLHGDLAAATCIVTGMSIFSSCFKCQRGGESSTPRGSCARSALWPGFRLSCLQDVPQKDDLPP